MTLNIHLKVNSMLRMEKTGAQGGGHTTEQGAGEEVLQNKEAEFLTWDPPGFKMGLQPTDGKLLGRQTYETVDSL